MIDLEKLINTILLVLTIIAVAYLTYVFYSAYVTSGWVDIVLLILLFICIMIQ